MSVHFSSLPSHGSYTCPSIQLSFPSSSQQTVHPVFLPVILTAVHPSVHSHFLSFPSIIKSIHPISLSIDLSRLFHDSLTHPSVHPHMHPSVCLSKLLSCYPHIHPTSQYSLHLHIHPVFLPVILRSINPYFHSNIQYQPKVWQHHSNLICFFFCHFMS